MEFLCSCFVILCAKEIYTSVGGGVHSLWGYRCMLGYFDMIQCKYRQGITDILTWGEGIWVLPHLGWGLGVPLGVVSTSVAACSCVEVLTREADCCDLLVWDPSSNWISCWLMLHSCNIWFSNFFHKSNGLQYRGGSRICPPPHWLMSQ